MRKYTDYQKAAGCLTAVALSVVAVLASVTVGVFFGAGFGLLALTVCAAAFAIDVAVTFRKSLKDGD